MSCKQKEEVHDVKSQSSTVGSQAGSMSAAARSCGVAPSGASFTGPPPVKPTLSLSGSSGEAEEMICEEVPVECEEEPVSKETWCRVESMPKESWLRRRRKHWPDQSKSTVFNDRCQVYEEEPRCDWKVHSKDHDERRHHFPGRRNTFNVSFTHRRRSSVNFFFGGGKIFLTEKYV